MTRRKGASITTRGVAWGAGLAVAVFALMFILTPGLTGMIAGSGFGGQQSPNTGDGGTSLPTADVRVSLDEAVTADADLFGETPSADSDANYGDYVDFDRAEAVTEANQANAYHDNIDLSNSETGDFVEVDTRNENYTLTISNTTDIHAIFKEDVAVPEDGYDATLLENKDYDVFVRVEADARNADPSTQVTQTNMILDSDKNVLTAPSTDFDESEAGVQYLRSEIEVDEGTLYLGDVDLSNSVLTSNDNISEAEIETFTVDGQPINALEGIELDGDYNYDRDILGASDSPMESNSDIVVELRYEFEDAIQDGNNLDQVVIEDIYGDQVASLQGQS